MRLSARQRVCSAIFSWKQLTLQRLGIGCALEGRSPQDGLLKLVSCWMCCVASVIALRRFQTFM